MNNKILLDLIKKVKSELSEYLDSSINYDDYQLNIIIEKLVLKNSKIIYLSVKQKKYIDSSFKK